MVSSSFSRPAALAAAGVALVIGHRLAAEEAPIELPKYTVTTERELPPPEQWYYARIEGFEVLSSAAESTTRKLIGDFQNFAYALDLVWPGIRPNKHASAKLIICGQAKKFEVFQPGNLRGTERVTSFHLRSREQAAIVLDQQTKYLTLVNAEDTAAAPGGDAQTSAAETTAQVFAPDAFQQLYREYIRFLLSARNVPPPPWLAEGLSQLLMNLHISATEISVGQVEDPNAQAPERSGLVDGVAPAAPSQDRDFNAALGKSRLMPMDELFATAADSNAARLSRGLWAKQCYAFVHWGLYGDFGKHQKEFITFLLRLDREPLSEEMFKACFKQDYREMLQALRSHIDATRFKFAGVRADQGQKIPWPPAPTVREATQAEVGRLTGEVLTLAGHPDDARTTMITAYRRGERDPALLAALGLAEANGGDSAKARKFLEAAAAVKVVRPRAYVELARLRLADVRAKPEGANGKLSSKQTASVLEPLFTARSQPPALPEVYELIAETWAASASSPGPAQLAVLDEGVRLYPRNAGLVYADATLQVKAGQFAAAEPLIRLGLRVTTDADLRAKYELLKAGRPAPPPAPAKS
ncbi:MAG: hypothetical protein PSW75_06085 [bacterium]|nr:hypothetical protein [bacterium]